MNKSESLSDYAYYKLHGFCVRCHTNTAEEGHVLCRACLKYHASYEAKVRAERRTHNRCVGCGARMPKKARQQYTYCAVCRAKKQERQCEQRQQSDASLRSTDF